MLSGESDDSRGPSELGPGTEADGGLDASSTVDCEPFVAEGFTVGICFAGVTRSAAGVGL